MIELLDGREVDGRLLFTRRRVPHGSRASGSTLDDLAVDPVADAIHGSLISLRRRGKRQRRAAADAGPKRSGGPRRPSNEVLRQAAPHELTVTGAAGVRVVLDHDHAP